METENQLPCAEKLTFDTQKAAEAATVVADYQHGTKLRAYKWRHCGLWHMATFFNE